MSPSIIEVLYAMLLSFKMTANFCTTSMENFNYVLYFLGLRINIQIKQWQLIKLSHRSTFFINQNDLF